MHRFSRAASLLLLPVAITFFAGQARADSVDNGPCGNFDFSGGLSCKIETSGGCTASCTPFKLEVACGGKCTASADITCSKKDCGEACLAKCDPKALDCFKGCHSECDQPLTDQCKAKNPAEDCVTSAKAQCDTRCKDSCKVAPSSCEEHCNRCCHGSCTAQANFDCDFKCRAELKGSCNAKCTKPEGAIFCNGQFVNASDIKSCVTYLATKNIKVEGSASGEAICGINGCVGDGKAQGCAVGPDSSNGVAGAFGLIGLATAAGIVRRRRRAS